MTHTQTTYTNRIALRAGKKGAHPAEVGALASVFEKSATELKHVVRLVDEWSDKQSKVKLDGFRASCVSSHVKIERNNLSVDDYIYIYLQHFKT